MASDPVKKADFMKRAEDLIRKLFHEHPNMHTLSQGKKEAHTGVDDAFTRIPESGSPQDSVSASLRAS